MEFNSLLHGIAFTASFKQMAVPLWIPCYLLASFILATAALVIISFYCANAVFVSRSPNYAGPLDALLAASKETPYIAATSCCLAVSRLADLLLLHRLFSIYRHKIWICFVPAIIWMCTIGKNFITPFAYPSLTPEIGSGICFIAIPILTKRRQLSRYVGIGHWSLAALFCVVTTTLIVIRLLRARGKVSPSPIVKEYTSIITLIVESSLAYTVVLVVFTISYGKGVLCESSSFPRSFSFTL
ncbi:hypothetical protein DL96DRAFT_852688 [Flagelloscypha sp. PMI_526]|nr:hypothetical protein DL96DRAFT_852688 [Flagelloscypha sp. PMI_526]